MAATIIQEVLNCIRFTLELDIFAENLWFFSWNPQFAFFSQV